MRVFLETERIILRRFTESDVDILVELDSDPEVLRYINGGIPTPRTVMQQEILPRFLSYYDRYDGYGFWAAIEKSTGEFIGWFCLRPEDGRSGVDVALGYRLRRSAWGKGYGTEGARALVAKGFSELGAKRIFAITYEYNSASRRVMEKAGLTLARTFHSTPEELAAGDTYVIAPGEVWDGDDVEYALEKTQWESR